MFTFLTKKPLWANFSPLLTVDQTAAYTTLAFATILKEFFC